MNRSQTIRQSGYLAPLVPRAARRAAAIPLIVLTLGVCVGSELNASAALQVAPAVAPPSGVAFPGPFPGVAKGELHRSRMTLENAVMAMTWTFKNGVVAPRTLTDRIAERDYDQTGMPLFRLSQGAQVRWKFPPTLTEWGLPPAQTALHSRNFHAEAPPKLVRIPADTKGVRLGEREGGQALECVLVNDTGFRVRWRAELRDGSNYLRQSFTIGPSNLSERVSLRGADLLDLRLDAPKTDGLSAGCPVVSGGLFAGVELPGSQNAVDGDEVRSGFLCDLWLTDKQNYSFGTVIGVAPQGQMRRAFLCYIERERARPSKPFLHYNCWYDLGFDISEQKMLDVAKAFDAELVKKRGVPVEAYLVDDGWDSPGKGLWIEDPRKFPNGLKGLNDKLAAFGTHPGLWISPMGGYGGAKERTDWAHKMKLMPNSSEFDLAQPGYKKWFQERCLQMMDEAGVKAFKWDRAGAGVSPHFLALLDVANTLHRKDPGVFINVTVGTWPSPFWLNHVDSTWRMWCRGGDAGLAGKGNARDRWLNYRDGYCREAFVVPSPLYPLNSCMHHGIILGRCFQGKDISVDGANIKNEVRSFFANGTSLQELYITPSMMDQPAWDHLAEAAKWGHANADVLRDAHWVGGDPFKGEPYGYAAWSPRKGTLMLRNPDDQAHAITLDAQAVFELPTGVAQDYVLQSPYKDQRVQSITLRAGMPQSVTLEPFEVLVFDAQAK